MKLTADELSRLDVMSAAGATPAMPPALPGLHGPASAAMLLHYRRMRLARR